MFPKVSIFLFVVPVFSITLQAAAVVTCSQPGFSQTVLNGACVVGSGSTDTLVYQGLTSASIVNGQYVVEGMADLVGGPSHNPGPYPMTASATWDDTFMLPGTNSADVYKIMVTGGGLNHPASIHAGPIDYTEADFCDAHYIGNPACTARLTVSASQINSVELIGSDSVSIPSACGNPGCGFGANSSLFELVTVQRFLADGVTPDPFTTTPEPSSLTFFLLAVPAGILIKRRRRC